MRKIIHVDMDAFYASVEQRDEPMTDGVAWNEVLRRAQRAGRSVRCFTAASDRQQPIAELERRGLTVVKPDGVKPGIIRTPTPSRQFQVNEPHNVLLECPQIVSELPDKIEFEKCCETTDCGLC